MLALYNDKIYKAQYQDDRSKVCLSTFKPVKGFEKTVIILTDEEIYKKVVNIEDVIDLYGISFRAEFMGVVLPAGYTPGDNLIHLQETGTTFAQNNGFTEIERGLWVKEVSIDDIDKFFAVKFDYKTGSSTELEVTKDEFVKLFIENVIDVD